MQSSKSFVPVIKIARYTILDEIRQKSFVVVFAVCVVFLLLIRGCYHANYMVNGQMLDAAAIAGTVSKAAFHGVSMVAMLIAALVSMRLFRRERDGGMQSCILSKPIRRSEYILGTVFGLWLLSTVLMLVLQIIVFVITAIVAKVVMPGYLVASLLCSLNVLFVVVVMLFLSLLMPEMIALLSVLGIAVIGLIADAIHALGGSRIAQIVIEESGSTASDISFGKILYYVWPKVAAAEHFASSFIGAEPSWGFWSVYPLVNILLYCLILVALLLRRFGREEIV